MLDDMKNLRTSAKLFDVFTKLIMIGAFITLALAFFNLYRDIGLGFKEEDLPAIGMVAAMAAIVRAIGMLFFRKVSRQSKPND